MRNTFKLIAILVAVTLILSLGGCNSLRKPATDPVPTLAPEEDETEAMAEQAADTDAEAETPDTEATEEADSEPDETEAAATPEVEETSDAEPTAEPLDPTATPVPNIEPSPTAVPTDPTPEPTVAPVPDSGKHVVQPGENLFRIALKYGLSTDAVAQANSITNPALVYVGQELTIPTGGTPTTSPSPSGKTHVVQPGENLFRIALKYGLDQNYLASYNGITNPALIYVGQVISIP